MPGHRWLFSFALLTASAVSSLAQTNFMVVRVGDGSGPLTTDAAAVFIEQRQPGGLLVGTVALPTTPNVSSQPVTLAGNATLEGSLARSADGNFLTLAGYAAAPGTAGVGTSSTADVNRVIAQIDAAGTVDATTRIYGMFEQNSIRGAVTANGYAFWVSGSATPGTGGIWYVTYGPLASFTQITTSPNMTRDVGIFNGQVYAISGSPIFSAPFAAGTGMPTTSGQASNFLPGYGPAGGSPCQFAFNTAGTVLYIADSRALASGGGVQKWTFDGSTWSLAATFTNGISIGVAGLCVDFTGAQPRVYTTTAATPNAIVSYLDDGSPSPTGTVIATAATNTAFRGLAIGPYGSQAAVEPGDVGAAFGILSCAPQPCREGANIQYALSASGRVCMELFDAQGRKVATLIDRAESAGRRSVALDARTLASGVYLLRLQAGDRVATRRLAHLR